MQNSLIEEKKKIPKFKNQEGRFWLEGVEINWKLEDSFGDYHFEFNSYCSKNKELINTEYKIEWAGNKGSGRIPNLISETGYRSHFEGDSFLDKYETITEYLIDVVEYFINVYNVQNKKTKKREYRLEFKDSGYRPSKQFTLIELEGGGK